MKKKKKNMNNTTAQKSEIRWREKKYKSEWGKELNEMNTLTRLQIYLISKIRLKTEQAQRSVVWNLHN